MENKNQNQWKWKSISESAACGHGTWSISRKWYYKHKSGTQIYEPRDLDLWT